MVFRFLFKSFAEWIMVFVWACFSFFDDITKLLSFLYWLQYNSNFWYAYIFGDVDDWDGFLTLCFLESKKFFWCDVEEFLDFILFSNFIDSNIRDKYGISFQFFEHYIEINVFIENIFISFIIYTFCLNYSLQNEYQLQARAQSGRMLVYIGVSKPKWNILTLLLLIFELTFQKFFEARIKLQRKYLYLIRYNYIFTYLFVFTYLLI